MRKRYMHFADNLYSSDPLSVTNMFDRFTHTLEDTPEMIWRLDMLVTYAIIVPHGEWKVSGFTANMAYRVLAGSPVDTVVVIGPSHHVSFNGISIADDDIYETPLGDITIDTNLVQYIKSNFDVIDYPLAHNEHSTEVQMPFIRHYLPNAKVVELVYGSTTTDSLKEIISYLLNNRRYAVVISTDLSHLNTLEDANAIDSICIDSITQVSIDQLNDGCEACGLIGVGAMLLAAQNEDLEGILLDYSTSADVNGDTSSVVGYLSALFQEKI